MKKVTKKQRKLSRGMNFATLQAFRSGHKPPQFHNFAEQGQPATFTKVASGVPFVNPHNFGM